MKRNLVTLVAGAGLALALTGCATTSNNYAPENTRPKTERIEKVEKYGTFLELGSFLYLLLTVL